MSENNLIVKICEEQTDERLKNSKMRGIQKSIASRALNEQNVTYTEVITNL